MDDRPRGRIALVLVTVLVSITAACASTPAGVAPALPTARLSASVLARIAKDAPCRLTDQNRHLADAHDVTRFPTVTVVRCVTTFRTYPRDGEWQLLVRQIVATRLRPLVTALEQPDQHTAAKIACPAIGYAPLPILLADGHGHYLHPRAPTTDCAAPQPAVVKALADATWRTVETVKVKRTRSAASVGSRCEMQWKNEARVYGGALANSAGGAVLARRPDAALHICLYGQATDPYVGTFRRSVTLTGAPAQQLRASLAGAGPTGDCGAQHEFAVISANGAGWVNVELGGCWRVVRASDEPITFGTANPTVVRRLLKLG
jgi:hypothetical protein